MDENEDDDEPEHHNVSQGRIMKHEDGPSEMSPDEKAEHDFDAAMGQATQALRGLVDDLALTGIDHLPRAKLSRAKPSPSKLSHGKLSSGKGRSRAERKTEIENRVGQAPATILGGTGAEEAFSADAGSEIEPPDETDLASVLALPSPAGDRLRLVEQDVLGDCRRCKLHRGRTRLVFGVGNPDADLVFVGEGPGAEEDRQGIPFVGRAGQLLTRMIGAMDLTRDDIYICNVVKCRPPNNRDPEPDEVESCEPFLKAQLSILKPRVIVGLGRCASQTLLRTKRKISLLRGQWTQYEGIDFMPTFHPSYLLRSPEKKREAWNDLQQVMQRLSR